MEPLFISQWTHDNHSLYELVPIFRKHPSRILLITMPMVIIIVIFFLALWGIFGFQDYTWLIPLPAACFYFIYVFYACFVAHCRNRSILGSQLSQQ